MKHQKFSENLSGASLILFVRYPSPGKVKSRLAESMGENAAMNFYRICAEKTFNECSHVDSKVKCYIFFSDKNDAEATQEWAGGRFYFSPQISGDLGERIKAALKEVFGYGATRVIVMASDVPDLSTRIIKEAINTLANNDLVVGPTFDGGYYLLGMKSLHEEFFTNISWSTPKVLGQTTKIAERLGLTITHLSVLRDIDTINDLREWLNGAPDINNPVLKLVKQVEL
jgi:rSAM/selenodomain-associated transferase 1